MITAYVILVIAVVIWKGYLAWKRGMRTYRRDLEEHDSLREYLLGNGASRRESLRPFVNHALERALKPLSAQWRLWLKKHTYQTCHQEKRKSPPPGSVLIH